MTTIPLCYPDNFKWNPKTNCLEPLKGKERNNIVLNPDAIDILKTIGNPFAVLCIAGPARSGKSFVLSELQDGINFDLGHTMTSHTTGIWMARDPMTVRLSDGSEAKVLLLDTEGIGAASSIDDKANEKFDNQIFTFSTLISSLLVYNSQGVPNAGDLEKLNFVANLCDSVHTQTKVGSTDYSALANFRKYSPDFFWLVRDMLLMPTDRNGTPCDIKKYLEENVLSTRNEDDNSVVQTKKNLVRKNIREMFPSFDAFGLPLPALNPDVVQHLDDPKYRDQINPDFMQKIGVVKSRLLKLLKLKRMQGANSLTGKELARLMELYIDTLNVKGSVPDWETAWDTTLKVTNQKAVETALQVYEDNIKERYSLIPCDMSDIMNKHVASLKLAIAHFRKETLLNADAMIAEEYIKLLMKKCAEFEEDNHKCRGGVLFELIVSNEQASEKLCMDLMKDLQTCHLESLLSSINSNTSFGDLLQSMDNIIQEYDQFAKGPKKKEIQEKNIETMHDRIKQADSEIRKLKDFDEKIQKEVQEKLSLEAECERKQFEKKQLEDALTLSQKQHEEKMAIIDEQKKKAEAENIRLEQQNREDKKRIEESLQNLNERHKEELNKVSEALKEQQKQQEAVQQEQFQKWETMEKERKKEMEKERERHHKEKMEMEQNYQKMREEISARQSPKPGILDVVTGFLSVIPIVGPAIKGVTDMIRKK